jgi:hypothetical protein
VNPNYDVRQVQGDNQYLNWLQNPEALNPPIYLPPYLGAQVFYSKLDISMDGQVIDGAQSVEHEHFQYQMAHRICSGSQLRRDKYGCPGDHHISNTSERATRAATGGTLPVAARAEDRPNNVAAIVGVLPVAAVPLYRHPNLVQCQNAITYEGRGGCAQSTMRMGFDGGEHRGSRLYS